MPEVLQVEDIVQIQDRFRSELGQVTDLARLDQLRRDYLGKNSGLKAALKDLRSVPEESRAQLAKLLNDAKAEIEAELDALKLRLEEASRRAQIETEWVDLSLPGIAPRRGGRHPVTEVESLCLGVLRQLGFKLEVGPEAETEFYNFDALNIPAHHPARDMQDTFFLGGGLLLRSHTTTVQARTLERRPPLPIKIASAGRVYRNEAVDATHMPMFHQLEGFWLDTDLTFAHLKGILRFVVQGLYGEERRFRFKPKYYPYTEPSIGMDIECITCHGAGCAACHGAGWVTIIGAGMIHRNVLQTFGYDPDEVSGIAFGWGTTRMASQWIGLGRIKSLYEQDLRLLRAIHGGDQ
jgi:phenylalanyl-tRNA synthetase alpha chain